MGQLVWLRRNTKWFAIGLVILVILGTLGYWLTTRPAAPPAKFSFNTPPDGYVEIDPFTGEVIDPPTQPIELDPVTTEEAPASSNLPPVTVGPTQKAIKIDLATATIIIILFIGFMEAQSRGERLLLDWWAPPLTIVVWTVKDSLPREIWLVMMTVCSILIFISVFFNESDDENWWSGIDTTSLFVGAGIMLLLKSTTYPQPEAPEWALWIVFGFSAVKELGRTPALGILAVILGVAMAFTLNPWVIAGAIILTTIIISISQSQGWVRESRHQTEFPIGGKIGKHKLAIILPWDNLIVQIFVFSLTAIQLYGNFLLKHLLTGGHP